MDANHSNVLDRFPLEVLASILQELDLPSLPSAVLSCQTMHRAYKEFPLTPTVILWKTIPQNIAPWAMTAFATSRGGPLLVADAPRETVVDALINDDALLNSWLHDPLRPLSWAHQLQLANLHRVVEGLSAQLVRDSLGSLLGPQAPLTADVVRISPSERFRLQRAFYMVEILTNILPQSWNRRIDNYMDERANELSDVEIPMLLQDRAAALVRSLAPWVVEQVDCAYNFLVKKASTIFEEVESHDMKLVGMYYSLFESFRENVEGRLRPTSILNMRAALMRRGLCQIYDFCNARTWWERRTKVRAIYWGDKKDPDDRRLTVDDALQCFHCNFEDVFGAEQSGEGKALSTFPQEKLGDLRLSRDRQDEELGPFETWSWLHPGTTVFDELPYGGSWPEVEDQFWVAHRWRHLRQSGHVFWDQSRPHMTLEELRKRYAALAREEDTHRTPKELRIAIRFKAQLLVEMYYDFRNGYSKDFRPTLLTYQLPPYPEYLEVDM